MNTKIISLVRHGKVDGPAALYGRTDIALSTQGYRDLRRTLNSLHAHTPVAQLISSPRLRCLQVAQEFAALHQTSLQIEENLREMDFGIWDGIAFDALGDEWKNIEAFWESPHSMHAPEGEALTDFAARVTASWDLLTSNTTAGHTIIVCHGGVIRIIIAHLLQIDWRTPALFKQLQIDYASHTRIEISSYENALPLIKWIAAPA
ncbi:MAG TPA: histidine phosphatase family protein [Cellvibrio sp.]|nr:histidine phosphatase family protein [Cellvibrio sp.]